MALADYQPETRVIPFSGGSFTVKGLSLSDITTLVHHHLPDLEALFDLGSEVIGGRTELSEQDVSSIAIALVEQAPGFVANLIALASGEHADPKAISAAGNLPFPLQVVTIVDIADLTFSEVGGIKKAFALVTERMTAVNRDKLKSMMAKVQ